MVNSESDFEGILVKNQPIEFTLEVVEKVYNTYFLNINIL